MIREATGFMCLMSVAVLGCARAPEQAEAYLVCIDGASYNAGAQVYGADVRHTFTLKNASSSTISIKKTSTSCGCLSAELSPRRLSPLQEANLEVHVRAEGKLGRKETVSVVYEVSDNGTTTSDRVLTCSLSLAIRRDLKLTAHPEYTHISVSPSVPRYTSEVDVLFHSLEEVATPLECAAPPWLKIEQKFSGTQKVMDGLVTHVFKLTASFDPRDVPTLPLRAPIEVRSLEEGVTPLVLSFLLSPAEDFEFDPPAIFCALSRTAPPPIVVHIRRTSGSRAKIVSIADGDLEWQHELRAMNDQGSEYVLTLLPQPGAEESFTGELCLTLAESLQPKASLRVAGTWE